MWSSLSEQVNSLSEQVNSLYILYCVQFTALTTKSKPPLMVNELEQ